MCTISQGLAKQLGLLLRYEIGGRGPAGCPRQPGKFAACLEGSAAERPTSRPAGLKTSPRDTSIGPSLK